MSRRQLVYKIEKITTKEELEKELKRLLNFVASEQIYSSDEGIYAFINFSFAGKIIEEEAIIEATTTLNTKGIEDLVHLIRVILAIYIEEFLLKPEDDNITIEIEFREKEGGQDEKK